MAATVAVAGGKVVVNGGGRKKGEVTVNVSFRKIKVETCLDQAIWAIVWTSSWVLKMGLNEETGG